MVYLVERCVDGEAQRCWDLGASKNIMKIGRNGDICEVVLSCVNISRSHATLQYTPPHHCVLIDLSTRNGTLYNGQRIHTQHTFDFTQQHTIQFADHNLIYNVQYDKPNFVKQQYDDTTHTENSHTEKNSHIKKTHTHEVPHKHRENTQKITHHEQISPVYTHHTHHKPEHTINPPTSVSTHTHTTNKTHRSLKPSLESIFVRPGEEEEGDEEEECMYTQAHHRKGGSHFPLKYTTKTEQEDPTSAIHTTHISELEAADKSPTPSVFASASDFKKIATDFPPNSAPEEKENLLDTDPIMRDPGPLSQASARKDFNAGVLSEEAGGVHTLLKKHHSDLRIEGGVDKLLNKHPADARAEGGVDTLLKKHPADARIQDSEKNIIKADDLKSVRTSSANFSVKTASDCDDSASVEARNRGHSKSDPVKPDSKIDPQSRNGEIDVRTPAAGGNSNPDPAVQSRRRRQFASKWDTPKPQTSSQIPTSTPLHSIHTQLADSYTKKQFEPNPNIVEKLRAEVTERAKQLSQQNLQTLKQKRKLLWAKKDQPTTQQTPPTHSEIDPNQYSSSFQANSERKSKFLKLMGYRSGADGGDHPQIDETSSTVYEFDPHRDKELEFQYYQGLQRMDGKKKGLGL